MVQMDVNTARCSGSMSQVILNKVSKHKGKINTGVLIFLQRPIHRVAYMCQRFSLQMFNDKPEQLYIVQNWNILFNAVGIAEKGVQTIAPIAEKLFKLLLWISLNTHTILCAFLHKQYHTKQVSFIFNFWKEHRPFFTDYGEVFLQC